MNFLIIFHKCSGAIYRTTSSHKCDRYIDKGECKMNLGFRSLKSGGEFSWFFQRLSGTILVVILLLHFFTLHFTAGGKITFEVIALRLSKSFWKTFDIVFLALALWHGLNGIRLVCDDYLNNWKWRTLILISLYTIGIIFFTFGSLTIISFRPNL